MDYTDEFYNLYAAYLKEPTVVEAHNRVLDLTIGFTEPEFEHVIDLGCGRHREFYSLFGPETYLGIDSISPEADIKADYRALDFSEERFRPYSSFVSLFSSEITAHGAENYDLYTKIFRQNPTIKGGLVSGFYYFNRRHENPIIETGDVVSFQTLDMMGEYQHFAQGFSEVRLTLHVPSRMFGPDVYEVWKIFKRIA